MQVSGWLIKIFLWVPFWRQKLSVFWDQTFAFTQDVSGIHSLSHSIIQTVVSISIVAISQFPVGVPLMHNVLFWILRRRFLLNFLSWLGAFSLSSYIIAVFLASKDSKQRNPTRIVRHQLFLICLTKTRKEELFGSGRFPWTNMPTDLLPTHESVKNRTRTLGWKTNIQTVQPTTQLNKKVMLGLTKLLKLSNFSFLQAAADSEGT